jgi:hypothetical protein
MFRLAFIGAFVGFIGTLLFRMFMALAIFSLALLGFIAVFALDFLRQV